MKKISSILFVCMITATAMAVPARREPIIRTAADGTEKEVYLHGNAFSHFMTDAEGVWLDETTLAPLTAEEKTARIEANQKRVQARRVQQAEKVGTEPNIAPRGLLILVNFADKAFVTPYETINDMLNGENFWRYYTYEYTFKGKTYTETVRSSGSARKYFQDQSYGQYNPVFDVVGPFTLSQSYSYYGKNTASGDDVNAGKMIKEACELADQNGADFTLYDNNKDGYVDFVYVIYAGYGEADGGPAETVWPHNYELKYYGINCTVDGKRVNNYACSNEINYVSNTYNGIGTFCHEFSHVLGLPDLYETNQTPKGVHTLYEWDILDYGPYNNDGNTPPAYSSYERFFCGWLKPRILKEPQAGWLGALNNGNGDAILLCDGDQHNLIGHNPVPKEFYLLESRIKDGWDYYLPGKGLLITKITYDAQSWEYNTVNNSSTKMGVDLIEAKKNADQMGKATDAFYYGSKSWLTYADHEVTEIEFDPTFGVVTFSYRYGAKDAIDEVQGEKGQSTKVLRDGKIIILRGDKEYDILGNNL